MLWLCSCKQANICMSVLWYVGLRKSTPETWVKFLVFFTIFSLTFIKIFIKSLIYSQNVPLGHLPMYVAKIVHQPSLSLFLTWVSLAIFCLEIVNWKLTAQIIVIGSRENSVVLKLCLSDGSSWATCKYNICPTSCTETSWWKRPISNSA